MKKNSFVVGTMVTYIALLLTKILGAVYVIPFYDIIGEKGGILYGYAYNVYNVFLAISTSGIPVAISIIISEFNAMKMFEERDYAYKIAIRLIGVISFIAFGIMYIFAKNMALFIIGDIDSSIAIESVVLVIRVVSFCLLVVPFLSVTRGYLQGNKFVSVSSFSQLVEQIIRISVALIGAYTVINIWNMEVSMGVTLALTGTVWGALGALLYLLSKIWKNKNEFEKSDDKEPIKVTAKEIIKKIMIYAIPVVIVSVSQNIYEIIDLKCILKGLTLIGYDADTTELLGSVIITWTPKICMIINSLAIGLCSSVIPFVVDSYVNKNKDELNNKFNQAIGTIAFITVPLAAFMIMFGKEVYYIFYGDSPYGGTVLSFLSVASIFFSVQMVMNMMLQGMKKYKIVYMNSITGVIINAALDIPLIVLLSKLSFYPYIGSILSTIIGQIVAITIIVFCLNKEFKFNCKPLLCTITKTLYATAIMIALLAIMKAFVPMMNGRVLVLIELGILGVISFGMYAFISYKNKTIFEIFGEDFLKNIMNKFKKKNMT